MRWLWLIFVLLSLQTNAQLVVFDRTLSQPVYIHDPGPSGISNLADELGKKDIITGTIQSSNLYNLMYNSRDDLSHYVVVFTPTIHRKYGNWLLQEIPILLGYGAHIIVIAEHENYYYNADNLNQICSPYGITINNNAIKKCTGNDFECAWPIGKSAKYGLNNLRFYLPASLHCADSVERIVTIDTAVVCASVKVGKGRLTVLGDYEMLWNMTPGHGINYGDNKAFLMQLFDVSPDTTVSYVTNSDWPYLLKQSLDKESPRRFLSADRLAPAYIAKTDVLFFINPTSYLTWPDSAYKKVGKAVIIGGEYSNYFKLLENEGGINILNTLGYKHRELPINAIAKHFGIQFSESVVNNGGLNHASLNTLPYCCMHELGSYPNDGQQGASYITTTKKDFIPVYKGDGSYVEQYYYGPLGFDTELTGDTLIPMPGQRTISDPLLCAYNSRVFVISSPMLWNELTSGSRSNNIMVEAFEKWLKMK